MQWGEHNLYGQPYARSCRFDNVCLNHSTLAWQFYWPEGPEPLFYRQQDAQAQHEFPDDFVATGAAALLLLYSSWLRICLALQPLSQHACLQLRTRSCCAMMMYSMHNSCLVAH